MQVTLTLPPDLIKQIAGELIAGIQKELAALMEASGKSSTPRALLTPKMVAKRLKLHEKTVIRYIRQGKINAANQGTIDRPSYRVSEDDLNDYYLSNKS